MSDIYLLSLSALSGWGILAFFTVRFGLIVTRNTLEPKLRKERLRRLGYRWYAGVTIGLLVFIISGFELQSERTFRAQFPGWLSLVAVVLAEGYFLVRYRLLVVNFRRYALLWHSSDAGFAYLGIFGGLLSLLTILP